MAATSRRHRCFSAVFVASLILAAVSFPDRCGAQLAGTYTIGGASPSFSTFGDAVNALRTGGITGPVNFYVRPGTYTEQLDIPQIAGASATNTITFQSDNGSAASVVLQFASTTAANNHVLRLNGADHIRFERLTFSTATFGAGFRRVVVLKGSVDDVRFDSDVFLGLVNNVTDPALYSAGDTLNDVVIVSNTFTGGSWAIMLKGVSSLPATGVRVSANTIGSVQGGIQLNLHRAPVVEGNTVNASHEGINLNTCDGPLVVRANRVGVHFTGGIELADCFGTASVRGLVFNNFIINYEIANGLYTFSSRYIDFVNNSILNTGSTITGSPFYEAGGSSASLNVVDNLIINVGSGYAYYVAVPAGIGTSDYNDLYTNGSSISRWGGVDQADLLVLQGVSGKDLHSVTRAVNFASSSDLHLTGASLGDGLLRGTPLAAVPVDIDGESRSLSAPYMGADEFPGAPLAVESAYARDVLVLHGPTPNPARSRATIDFILPRPRPVRLAIFDAGGRRVRALMDGVLGTGRQQAQWDGRDDFSHPLPSGTYFFELEAGAARLSRKAVLLR